MTMLANRTEKGNPALPGRALTLADYEARIHLYKEQIGTGYIGIGRTLLEAKEAKVVPHGQWESWVTETTGLTPRQAQRCMQAATEIKDGTAMARLEMSKALMLLGSGLDEETREEIAGKAVEEGATVNDLREQLRKAKLQIVQETGAATEIRDALRKAEAERDQIEGQMREMDQAYKARLDEAREDAYKRGEMAGGADAAARIRELEKSKGVLIDEVKRAGEREHPARTDLANTSQAYERQKNRIDGLQNELNKQKQYAEDLRKELDRKHEEAVPADFAKDREILLAAAEEAEKRAADAEAELEALRAGGAGQPEPVWKVLKVAMVRFMTDCELMPLDPAAMIKDRHRIETYLDQIDKWSDMMRIALAGTVSGEGAVE